MRVTKQIAATAAAMYQAFMSAEALTEWLPPSGMKAKIHSFDAKRGYRMTLTGQGGGKTTENSDTVDVKFVALAPNERIVQDCDFESDDPAFAGTMRMTWTFLDGEVAVEVANQPRGISDADHEAGIQSSLDQLADYVTRSR